MQVQKSGSATEKVGSLSVPVGAGEFEVAKVISVGPKVEGVSVDDTVYIYIGAGKEFSHEGTKYRTITTSEVIAVV